MSELIEPYYMDHCDEGCGLGYLAYQCPMCKKEGQDFGDGWWKREDVYCGARVFFDCEHCREPLSVSFNPDTSCLSVDWAFLRLPIPEVDEETSRQILLNGWAELPMEKQGVINDKTPTEGQEKTAMREDRFYKKLIPPLKITNDELDRSDMAKLEEHVTKRLSDKVQEKSDG